jgi:hypothetical protein
LRAVLRGDLVGVTSNLIQGLIDTDVFPEPDESGGRNGYFVMMPQGSTDTSPSGPCGAHGQQVDTGFLGLDPDHAWVAYVNFGTLDVMTSCFSHELAELLTDPEQSAWFVNGVPGSSSEIGDLCDIRENWVHGVKVRSYWSNRDQMCVIPTDAYYSVCINGTIDEIDRTKSDEGKASAKSPEGGLSVLIPTCNFEGAEFNYTSYKHVETASLAASATDYHAPVFTWSVAGQALAAGNGTISIKADVTYPSPGGFTRTSTDIVILKYSSNGASLALTNDQVPGNFDVLVSVSVDEDPTQGAQAINGARTSGVVVSFVGLTIDESDYQAAVKRCQDAALEFWKSTHPDTEGHPGPVNPGPIHEDDLSLFHQLPGWVTSRQREAIRMAIVQTSQLRTEMPEQADGLRTILLGVHGLSARA